VSLRREIKALDAAAAKLAANANLGRWSTSSQIQTLLFARHVFTLRGAMLWARKHGFRASKVDSTENYYRLRQQDPGRFSDFRTIELADGVRAIVGPKA